MLGLVPASSTPRLVSEDGMEQTTQVEAWALAQKENTWAWMRATQEQLQWAQKAQDFIEGIEISIRDQARSEIGSAEVVLVGYNGRKSGSPP